MKRSIKWRDSKIPVVKADRRWLVSMARVTRVSKNYYAAAHGRLYFDPKGKAYELTKDSRKKKPTLYLYVEQLGDYVPIVEVQMDDVIRDTWKRMKAREVKYGRKSKQV